MTSASVVDGWVSSGGGRGLWVLSWSDGVGGGRLGVSRVAECVSSGGGEKCLLRASSASALGGCEGGEGSR